MKMPWWITFWKSAHAVRRIIFSACFGLLFDRNPYEYSLKSASNTGSIAIFVVICTIRSLTVGIPSSLSLPSGFGIITLFTGDGIYFPSISSFLSSFRYFSIPIFSISSILIPSTPPEPLLAFTLIHFMLRSA